MVCLDAAILSGQEADPQLGHRLGIERRVAPSAALEFRREPMTRCDPPRFIAATASPTLRKWVTLGRRRPPRMMAEESLACESSSAPMRSFEDPEAGLRRAIGGNALGQAQARSSSEVVGTEDPDFLVDRGEAAIDRHVQHHVARLVAEVVTAPDHVAQVVVHVLVGRELDDLRLQAQALGERAPERDLDAFAGGRVGRGWYRPPRATCRAVAVRSMAAARAGLAARTASAPAVSRKRRRSVLMDGLQPARMAHIASWSLHAFEGRHIDRRHCG